jgi:hypothetical protein
VYILNSTCYATLLNTCILYVICFVILYQQYTLSSRDRRIHVYFANRTYKQQGLEGKSALAYIRTTGSSTRFACPNFQWIYLWILISCRCIQHMINSHSVFRKLEGSNTSLWGFSMGPLPRTLRIIHTPAMIPDISGTDCVELVSKTLDIIITNFHTLQIFGKKTQYLSKNRWHMMAHVSWSYFMLVAILNRYEYLSCHSRQIETR